MQLPKERCAGYMRREELSTVSMVHKASAISEAAKTENLHLNTDGTTLQQRKLGGLAINGMVISVNELPDGTADAVVVDVSKELTKLREMAHSLGLPNADAINWSLVSSSTSDSAATQKRFNRLMEERKEADIERFGVTSADDALEIWKISVQCTWELLYERHSCLPPKRLVQPTRRLVVAGTTIQQMCSYTSAVSLLADMVHPNMAPVFLSSLTFWT